MLLVLTMMIIILPSLDSRQNRSIIIYIATGELPTTSAAASGCGIFSLLGSSSCERGLDDKVGQGFTPVDRGRTGGHRSEVKGEGAGVQDGACAGSPCWLWLRSISVDSHLYHEKTINNIYIIGFLIVSYQLHRMRATQRPAKAAAARGSSTSSSREEQGQQQQEGQQQQPGCAAAKELWWKRSPFVERLFASLFHHLFRPTSPSLFSRFLICETIRQSGE